MNHDFNQSRTLLERAKRSIAGGVTSNVRINAKPLPLYFERGEGAMLFDVDGNSYVDYALGQGPAHPGSFSACRDQRGGICNATRPDLRRPIAG